MKNVQILKVQCGCELLQTFETKKVNGKNRLISSPTNITKRQGLDILTEKQGKKAEKIISRSNHDWDEKHCNKHTGLTDDTWWQALLIEMKDNG